MVALTGFSAACIIAQDGAREELLLDSSVEQQRQEIYHQRALTQLARALLAPATTEEASSRMLSQALLHLCEAIQVDQVLLLESIPDSGARSWRTAATAGTGNVINDQALPEELLQHLQTGTGWHGLVARSGLEPGRAQVSVTLSPIHCNDHCWGTLACVDASVEREWSGSDIDTITSAAEILATALLRLQNERERREDLRMLLAIAASSPFYFSVINRDLTVGFTSGSEFSRRGLDPESFVGLTLDEVFHEHAPEVKRWYREAFAGKQVSFELVFDGQHQLYRPTQIRDEHGRVEKLVVFVEDISDRRRAELAVQEHTAQLEALREVELDIAAELDLESVLRSVVNRARDLIKANQGGLFLYQPDRDLLEWTVPPDFGFPVDIVLRRGEGLAGKVWETGSSIVIDDYSRWEGRSKAAENLPIAAIVGAPVRWGDDFLGVLVVLSDTPAAFAQTDAELLEMCATQAAIAIRNARLYEQTEQDRITKVALLREVNHRVSNNLASIIGLISLEEQRAGSDRHIFEDLKARIRGLSVVHHMLSDSEWSPISLRTLATRVVRSSLSALPSDKSVDITIMPSPVEVSARHANTMALIFNELTTNSIKHAWSNRSSGRISVEIKNGNGSLLVVYRDDGVGFSEEALKGECPGIGWNLVTAMVSRDLGGKVARHNDNGAVTKIELPRSEQVLPVLR
jgi:two-component sensor histidine kinase